MGEAFLNGSPGSGARLEVGPMTEADLEEVLSLERSGFLSPWSKEAFVKAFRDPKGIHLVGRLGRRVVAYITSFLVLDEVCVTNLLVAPEQRRTGLGTALLEEFVRRVRERKARHIFLEVRERNTAAIRFYERLGFRVVGVRKGYYTDTGEDALVMKISFEETPGDSPGSLGPRAGPRP